MRYLFSILLILLLNFYSYSQTANKQKTIFKNGNYYYLFEEYENAIESYLEVLTNDTGNANLNYKIGLCYLSLPDKNDNLQSIKYLEKATKAVSKKYNESSPKERNTPIDTWYYLANAYRLDMKFDDAYNCYQSYLNIVPEKQKQVIEYVKREQVDCKNAKDITLYRKVVDKKQLGINIESAENIQSCPIISNDGSALVFCMGQNNIFPPDFNLGDNNDHYEIDDIYYSLNIDGKWSKPENIMTSLKTKELTLPVSISNDGTSLYLVRDDNDNGNLYESKRVSGKWQPMKKLNRKINTKHWETHASLCNNEQTLYFTSDKPGGLGGLDIYKSTRTANGDWGKAENLGPTINSRFDEETPYFDDTRKALYFSSQGHYSMGGFDIFCSLLSDTGFTEPLNIGFPINSVGNDLVYISKIDTTLAYASLNSYDLHDTTGNNNDLYAMQNPTKLNIPEYTAKGTLTANNDNIAQNILSKLIIVDSLSRERVLPVEFTLNNNVYSYVISSGEHRIIYKLPGFKNHTEIFMLPKIYGNNELNVNIKFEPSEELLVSNQTTKDSINNIVQNNVVNNTSTEKYIVRNMFFDFDKYQTKQYAENFDSIAKYLKNYSDTRIKLTGYADALGDKNYNLMLSKNRAIFVKEKLVLLGANSNQIEIDYKGVANPIASNNSKESRKYNRRVEISIITDGNAKLSVEPIKVPDGLK